MAEVSKKLGLMESVRHVCQAVQIPLPGVVVVGEQSAGKSSLLENISGIQFPRAQNTCTRMPCVLTMLTDPTVNECFALVSMDSSFTDAACRMLAKPLCLDGLPFSLDFLDFPHLFLGFPVPSQMSCGLRRRDVPWRTWRGRSRS